MQLHRLLRFESCMEGPVHFTTPWPGLNVSLKPKTPVEGTRFPHCVKPISVQLLTAGKGGGVGRSRSTVTACQMCHTEVRRSCGFPHFKPDAADGEINKITTAPNQHRNSYLQQTKNGRFGNNGR